MNLEDARKQFPHIARGMTYLNHAAISPIPNVVRFGVDTYYQRRSASDIELRPWTDDLAWETKGKVAAMLHTTPERLAFVHNTADGVSILSSGIDWNEGDRVLLYKYEYPANVYPYLLLENKGVTIDYMDSDDHRITLDVIKKLVTPKTRLIALSVVQSVTGYRADIEAIGAYCKEKNIIFSLDAIQGLPQAEVDVEKAQVDFLAIAVHKWLMASEGTALVYVSEKIQSQIRQISMGAASVENPSSIFDYDMERMHTHAGRYETGMLNYPGIAGLSASLDFQSEFGAEEIRNRVHAHSGYLISQLKTRGVQILTPEAEKERSGIVTFVIKNPDEVNARLQKKNIVAKVVNAIGTKFLRLSPHFYNTEEELKLTLDTIFA